MPLTREKLDALPDLTIREVEVPGWPDKVCVRELTALDRLRLQTLWQDEDQTSLLDLLLKAICDPQGKRLYRDDEKEALGSHRYESLSVLIDVALELNGMTATAVEQAEKNSDETDGGSSGSS